MERGAQRPTGRKRRTQQAEAEEVEEVETVRREARGGTRRSLAGSVDEVDEVDELDKTRRDETASAWTAKACRMAALEMIATRWIRRPVCYRSACGLKNRRGLGIGQARKHRGARFVSEATIGPYVWWWWWSSWPGPRARHRDYSLASLGRL